MSVPRSSGGHSEPAEQRQRGDAPNRCHGHLVNGQIKSNLKANSQSHENNGALMMFLWVIFLRAV
jgi:hypothetical protein